MNPESVLWAASFFLVAGIVTLTNLALQQKSYLRRLDDKLTALLKAQGVAWPHLSPEVQRLAQNGQKIAAIKLHREENPSINLSDAKADVESLAISLK